MPENNDPRYPIGTFRPPATITAADRAYAVQTIGEMPEQLREALRSLDEDQLNTPYREGGWTVRQLVHHIADSHMTAFHRFRKALTEDWPEVPGYDEKAFALLPDSAAPVEWSVAALEGVHARWVLMMQEMTEEQWQRGFRHTERGRQKLELSVMLYSWHAQHHVAHITSLRTRQGW